MEVTEVKIVEIGVSLEIRITINNGLRFYTRYGFETVSEAREALEAYGLRETGRE